jgi:hypothetical protein
MNPKTRFSRFFKLDSYDQSSLDFLDIRIGVDIPVFLDPTLIKRMNSEWASECTSILQHFFEFLMQCVKENNSTLGIRILSGLNERDEFHLGYSSGLSSGSGVSVGFATEIWESLSKSKAAQTGMLEDLEDTALFIHGISTDRISDAVCNILRAPLIKYTQDVCKFYDIPIEKIDAGQIWDLENNCWKNIITELPKTPYGKIILVPKTAVHKKISYQSDQYYRHYILTELQHEHILRKSPLTRALKDGSLRVDKKRLIEEYGFTKNSITNQTIGREKALDKYRSDRKTKSLPISAEDLSNIHNEKFKDIKEKLDDVLATNKGNAYAKKYEDAIEKLFTPLFFDSLNYPTKQARINNGRKIIDLRYTNYAPHGFFQWVAEKFGAPYVTIECKNYTKDIENPEFDQMIGRFNRRTGLFGIICCRKIDNKKLILERCKDAAKSDQGYIIVLTDDDLKEIVKEKRVSNHYNGYDYLKRKFDEIIS